MKRFFALTLLACTAALTACQSGPLDISSIAASRMSDEERVAAVLDDVQRGLHAHRIYKVLAHVSRSYFDSQGRDYAALQALLTSAFEKYAEITVKRVRPRIVVTDGRAQAFETFALSAEPTEPAVDPPIEWHGRVTIYLELVGNAWKIVEVGPIH